MSDTTEMNQVIHVKMFGGFSVSMEGHTLSDDENRSRKAWNLLCYLIINRRKDISVNELFEAVWQEDVQDNPYGALKTLVFRVRKMLEGAGFPGQELVQSQKGAYTWNPDWETIVDVDQFEFLCRICLSEHVSMKEVLPQCRDAFELYKGMFLPKASDESWADPLNAYYHSLYRRLVCRMAEYYLEKEDYEEMLLLSSQAADIDPFSEDFHYYRIYAIYKMGDEKEALQQYKEVTERFYRERQMTPSEHFKDLYNTISSSEQEVVLDLSQIQGYLESPSSEAEQGHGAYHCEYTVFKRLVQLERRRVERTGASVYLCLLTVGNRKGKALKPEIQARAMERLKGAIQSSLRSSDTYSRYSVSQYILLLPGTTYENGERVMNRIMVAFNKAYIRKDVGITASLNAVLPRG